MKLLVHFNIILTTIELGLKQIIYFCNGFFSKQFQKRNHKSVKMGVKTLLSSSNYNLQFQLREQMKALDLIPYNIQIDKLNLRAAVSRLFQTSEQFLAHCSAITNQTIDIINPVSMMWSYNGPQSGIKLIAVIRQVLTRKPKNPNLKQVRFFYGSVVQVDLDQNVIDPIVIFERIDSLQNKIRGFAVHPTGKQLVVVSEKKIQKFFLLKSQENKREYKLTLQQQKPITYTCTDLKYHPSGQYLLAMSMKGTEIRPVRIDAKSLQVTRGPDLNKKCLNAQQIVYRKKEIFTIDRNNPSVAAACHNSSKVCIFDIENLNENQSVRIKQIQINNTITNFHKPQLDWDKSRLFTRIGVINQTKQSKYVLYQPTYQIANMFTLSENDKGLSFSYQKYNKKNTDPRFTSCIDIVDINSLCCYHDNYYIFEITKLDVGTNISYSLGQVETADMRPVITVFDVENMFYYENNSEICMIINEVIFCFPIKTICTSNTQKTLINNCYSICRQQNKYWNPITMRCEDCNGNCNCTKATHSFNPYYNSCVLDCQKIPKASPITAYANSTKCVCEHSFQWNEQKQMCQANCTDVKYSLGVHPDRVFQCKCPANFVFRPFDQTFYAPGECILICENGQPSLVNQGKPSCKCGVFQQWNDSTNSCNRLQTIFTLPIWLIVLISILSVVVVGLLIFCIYKIKKRKIRAEELKKQEENRRAREQPSPFNDFNLKIQPVLNRNLSEILQQRVNQIDTNRQIYNNSNSGSAVSFQHQKKQCCICQQETQPGVNVYCKSQCGHYFHFQCLKNKIDSYHWYKCSQCGTVISLQTISQIMKQEREGILQINSDH